MNEQELRQILQRVLEAGLAYPSLEKGMGVATSHLAKQGVASAAREMVQSKGPEYRLNGAGLKLYFRWGREPSITVGGDQADSYFEAVEAIRKVLDEEGVLPNW